MQGPETFRIPRASQGRSKVYPGQSCYGVGGPISLASRFFFRSTLGRARDEVDSVT